MNPNYRHGYKGTKTYFCWKNMKTRCNNPNFKQYVDYGGRGITYDPRWEDFVNFLSDMGDKPEGMSLDRINNDKGYSKDNCRWATAKEQNLNKRDYRVEYKSKSGIKGVVWHKRKQQWMITIKKKYIGYCDTLEEAMEILKCQD